MTNGLRGIASFEIVVSGPKKDLHSGTFGGMIFEPMTDLIQVMARLVDSHGRMLIPGIYADVEGLHAEEEYAYILDFPIVFDQAFAETSTKPCNTRSGISKRWPARSRSSMTK